MSLPHFKNARHVLRRGLAYTLLVTLGVFASACDTSTDPGLDDRTVVLEGRATTTPGYGKASNDVDGASVTAASVRSNGSLIAHTEEATTDAEGSFELGITAQSDVVVVMASKSGYEARALTELSAATGSRVRVMPLTMESTAEADVFVETQEQGHSHVTTADVGLLVNADLASQLQSGASSVSAAASAVGASVAASHEFLIRQGEHSNAVITEARNRQKAAFFQLQSELSAAADASAEVAAMDAFAHAMVNAWADAGIDANTQAKAREAGVSAVVRLATNLSSASRLEVRKQAMYLAALARSLAVEAELEAGGASSATLASLASARVELLAEIRAAASANALSEAWSGYRSEAEAGLAATTEFSASQISAAVSAVQSLRSTLDASLATASSARAVAEAHLTFDSAADAALSASLDGSSDVTTAANVLLLLSF
jgi:hypothetical protein